MMSKYSLRDTGQKKKNHLMYTRDEQQKIYSSKPEVKKRKNKRQKERYHEDPVFRVKQLLSKGLYRWCKQIGMNKGGKTEELVGYSGKEFKEHLESLFKDGMTWENHGKGEGGWEIDHRIPQSYFIEIDQLKECFALENLKPEWREWNQSKGNRFIG